MQVFRGVEVDWVADPLPDDGALRLFRLTAMSGVSASAAWRLCRPTRCGVSRQDREGLLDWRWDFPGMEGYGIAVLDRDEYNCRIADVYPKSVADLERR